MNKNIKWIVIVLILTISLAIFIKDDKVIEYSLYEYKTSPKDHFHSPMVLSENDEVSTDPIVNPNQEYTYDQMVKDIEALGDNYHGLVTSEVIGESVDGREIYTVKLGYGEKEILIHAATHAREWITTNLVMNQIDLYSQAFVKNESVDSFDARELLQEVSIYYVPMVNPDGVTLVQKGADALGNSEFLLDLNDGNTDFAHWKANARGIDLNRNWSVGWGNAHSNTGEPGSINFRGYEPMSEPEVKALAKFIKDHEFQLAIAYHSSGELVYWGRNLPDGMEDEIHDVAHKISDETGYPMHRGASGGMFSDWFVHEIGKPGITPEVGPYAGPGPVPLEDYNRIWRQNHSVGLMLADYVAKDKK